jgi:thiosulfate sulfurtransferase
MIKQINVVEAAKLIEDQNALVVDIRDQNSFDQGHIINAVRIDNDSFQEYVETQDKSLPLIVCCYHGNSSQAASGAFNSHGFDAYSLEGGISSWALTQPTES